MVLHLSIPQEAEDDLRQGWGDKLDEAALHSLVIEGYRLGKLSMEQVRRILKLDSRWDAEAWLGKRGVTWNYSLEDLEADRRTISRLFPESK